MIVLHKCAEDLSLGIYNLKTMKECEAVWQYLFYITSSSPYLLDCVLYKGIINAIISWLVVVKS